MKLWDKGEVMNSLAESFTVGKDPVLDLRLIQYDCRASAAHAAMLGTIGILRPDEVETLCAELTAITVLAEKNQFPISKEEEDCHTAIENHLTKKLGEAGKKIHTFRSRNDQVLAALRLYYKDELSSVNLLLTNLCSAGKHFIDSYGFIPMPGFTHTRKAMPSSMALWMGAFCDAWVDDQTMVSAVLNLVDQSPLGTGAGYGLPDIVDRNMVAQKLGFARIQKNPIYVQNSRGKFEAWILNLLSSILFDLNKLASDLILFSMPEFGFFRLPERFLTGSSIMPQKKNPDVLELIRGHYHTVVNQAHIVQNTTANLISGYHRDMQLTKEPVFAGFDSTKASLSILNALLELLQVNEERCKEAMTEELFAADKAYELVLKGVPFREAYRRVAESLFPRKPNI